MPAKGQLVAEGAYTHHHGDATTGHSTWQFSKLAHGGLLLDSRTTFTDPPTEYHFTYQVTQHWSPTLVTLRVEAGGKTVTSEQRAAGAQWRAHIEPRGEVARESAVDFTPKHEVSFASPLFTTVTLVRLNLQIGQSREVDAVRIDPQTLEPRAVKQTYTCVAEEKIAVPAGGFSARRYTLTTDGGADEDSFWVDRHGIVLLYQSANGDATKLTHYRRIER